VQVFAGLSVSGFATERASFFDAIPVSAERTIRLADEMAPQRVALPFEVREIAARMREFRASEQVTSWDFPQAEEMGLEGGEGVPVYFRYLIRLKIADVYRGRSWEDTCIAEMWPDYGSVTGVQVSEDERALVIRTPDGRRVRTYSEFGRLLTLVEVSDNGCWAIVLEEPAYADSGRVTTEHAVIHTPTGRDMTATVFGDALVPELDLLPVGFASEDGRTYLHYEDLATGERRRTPCTPY
jgi:hypothetical protein